MTTRLVSVITLLCLIAVTVSGAERSKQDTRTRKKGASLYDVPPRTLVDLPTAGTLPRGHFDIGVRIYGSGGAVGYTNVGLSNRLMLGISYGAEHALFNQEPDWNPDIEFGIKFRLIDELPYFPAISVGYNSQGEGPWNSELKRYAFKSRGFYAVASRSFYFYKWTSGWHAGINYSREYKVDNDENVNLFAGFDATFNYNLALLFEYDAALNDDRSSYSDGSPAYYSGKGRGYFNMSVKWLFADNLELEVMLKDILVNRREADTFSREVRMTYIDHF